MTDSAPKYLAVGVPAQRNDFLLARRYRVSSRLAPPNGTSMLDFGCGNGAQSFSFAADFDRIVGVDLTLSSLQQLMSWRGEAPIYARMTIDGMRSEISTRRWVLPEYWERTRQLAIGRSERSRSINTYLEGIRSKIYKQYLELIYSQYMRTRRRNRKVGCDAGRKAA